MTYLRYILEMPRYEYISPFQLWYQYDCNWWPITWNLLEARELAEAKHINATIGVKAKCKICGLEATASALIYIRETIGKTNDEVYEMIDQKLDEYIKMCERPGSMWTAHHS